MADYSYGAIFASEVISMMMAIYFGESVIANEVLSKTKGRSMGWGFVALGFGLSFGIAILTLGYISTRMNPAVALAELILGQINGVEFVVIVCGDFVGAFVGAVLVWLHFLPHFKNIPAPYTEDVDLLLLGKEGITTSAVSLASYNPMASDVSARKKGLSNIQSTWEDIKCCLKQECDAAEYSPVNSDLVEKALGHDAMLGHESSRRSSLDKQVSHGTGDIENIEHKLWRRSAQIADVHNRLQDMDLEEYKNMMIRQKNSQKMLESKKESLDNLYKAAVTADQNAKLSIFATRPAIYSPIFNFLTEFLSTTSLIFPLLMILQRSNQMYEAQAFLYDAQLGLSIGFFVFLLVLGLGGPTALAANPARDFGPRCAHFLLPIPGKGKSEFYYAWIPILAPCLGGCAAAGLYAAVQTMNRSNV
ncbi:hypothetical protein M9434_004335 [Picochlorum sp. BPE23]|nr:hypothetical protein M9434_004335 [Picochlorum sp. BPE23]